MTTAPALRRCWHAVAFVGALHHEPLPRRVLGREVVLTRAAGGDVIAAGAAHCREHAGMIWVCLDHEPLNELPVVAELDDPRYRRIEVGVFEYACNAAAVIDNNTDATHVAFVHAATFGAGQDPRIPVGNVGRTSFGIAIDTDFMAVASRPGSAAESARSTRTEIWLPFTQLSRMRYPDGLTHILFKGMCPVDDDHTVVHLSVLRSDVDQPGDDGAIVGFESAVEAEDAVVLATLPAAFPLDPLAQVHLKHDRPGIEYRRALADLLGR
jgi:phenylpropionate dioxygenase-like ring-hydroxylating dioxygenase large terminal subunit